MGGPGRFDSVIDYTSGTYDQQTGFGFDKQMFAEMRAKLMFNPMSKTGEEWDTTIAGGQGAQDVSGSAIVKRVKITSGDEIRYTMEENMIGAPTYGDKQHQPGDFGAFKNMYAKTNMINSPAVPIVGEVAQHRIKDSITNLEPSTRAKVLNWLAQQLDWEDHCALIYGAGPSVLLTTANGGLGHSLGVNAGGGAGVPLMNRWWWMGGDGWVTYSTTPATYNAAVNTAFNAIGSSSGDYVTLAQLKKIRSKMDTEHFGGVTFMGKPWKAVALTDGELFYRIQALLAASGYLYAAPRGLDNPWFDVDCMLVYDGILYVNDPTLQLMRPTYNSGSGHISSVADFGPAMEADFRDYSNTQTLAMIHFLGRNAIIEGYDGSVIAKDKWADFDKGCQVAARTMHGALRGEWYAKDGRTDAATVRNYSVMSACFYEPGVAS